MLCCGLFLRFPNWWQRKIRMFASSCNQLLNLRIKLINFNVINGVCHRREKKNVKQIKCSWWIIYSNIILKWISTNSSIKKSYQFLALWFGWRNNSRTSSFTFSESSFYAVKEMFVMAIAWHRRPGELAYHNGRNSVAARLLANARNWIKYST